VSVARESGSIDFTNCFFFLATLPYAGRARDEQLAPVPGFSVGEYVIVYCVDGSDGLILRAVHGKRDLEVLFER
jgi:plasmid stabilization system protein ParE